MLGSTEGSIFCGRKGEVAWKVCLSAFLELMLERALQGGLSIVGGTDKLSGSAMQTCINPFNFMLIFMCSNDIKQISCACISFHRQKASGPSIFKPLFASL